MFYNFTLGLQEVDPETVKDGDLLYGSCTTSELETYIRKYDFSLSTMEELKFPNRVIHKMDSYYGYNFGLFHALYNQKGEFSKITIGLYITEHMVLVVCDDSTFEKSLYDAVDKMNEKSFCLEHMVTAILNCIIVGNLKMIEGIETELNVIDEGILNNKTENFNQRTKHIRDQLAYLTHYYEQLLDVCEELLQDENTFFRDSEIHHLRILADRVNRLDGNVHMLKDYLLQIREACQSQMDANLNHIMYIFTVVTTIFLPLTLIVGWYGMNFHNMPELAWEYGYITVIVLSILIVLICIWFFRRKKLLK